MQQWRWMVMLFCTRISNWRIACGAIWDRKDLSKSTAIKNSIDQKVNLCEERLACPDIKRGNWQTFDWSREAGLQARNWHISMKSGLRPGQEVPISGQTSFEQLRQEAMWCAWSPGIPWTRWEEISVAFSLRYLEVVPPGHQNKASRVAGSNARQQNDLGTISLLGPGTISAYWSIINADELTIWLVRLWPSTLPWPFAHESPANDTPQLPSCKATRMKWRFHTKLFQLPGRNLGEWWYGIGLKSMVAFIRVIAKKSNQPPYEQLILVYL